MSATKQQSSFITDLVLAKFRTFAEFKKWLGGSGIVRTNGQIFKQGVNLLNITNRITEKQASEIITEVTKLEDVEYKGAYDQEQIDEVNDLLAEIKKEVQLWTFKS